MYTYIFVVGGKGRRGLSANIWYHSEYRVLLQIARIYWCIYFCTFLNTTKLFSSVKFSQPNNKFSIGITVYGVIFINNCILAFV